MPQTIQTRRFESPGQKPRMPTTARSAVQALAERAASAEVQQVVYAPITRIDESKREVTVTATSERQDTFDTRFNYEASKDAFDRWERTAGNIREMHQPKAVGKAVSVIYDDATRRVDVTLRVSKGAQDTWEKIRDGTLVGASIGASNVVWEKPITRDAGKIIPIAMKYDLVELSLVDNPSNPDCRITAIRAAEPDLTILDPMEDIEPMAIPIEVAARMAGDKAASAVTPRATNESPAEWVARVALARGQAELDVMLQMADTTRDSAPMISAAQAYTPAPEHALSGAETDMHDEAMHTHSHAHTHDNGTRHAHPHVHGHGHGDIHRAAGFEDAPHEDHIHVTEKGELIDARLSTAVDTRKTPKSMAGKGGNPGVKAISGSDVFSEEKPTSPIMSVQPEKVGHRVLMNTEDPEAKEFGVPEPDDGRKTPGDKEDGLYNDPEQFHPGGHEDPEGKLTGGTYDNDGDNDGDGEDLPMETSKPPKASTIPFPKSRPGFDDHGGRAAEAEELRAGQRLSEETRDQLHDIRDGHFDQITSVCNLCNCPLCQDIMSLIHSAQNGDDDDDGDEGEGSMERLALAEMTRSVQESVTDVQRQMQAIQRAVAAQQKQMAQSAQALTVAEETRAQMANIERSIAETGQFVKVVASVAEGLDARVAAIEAQPVGGGPAMASLMELKRLSTSANLNEISAEQRAQVITDFARQSTDPRVQVEAFAHLFPR